jgi:hypothetical protein
MVCTQWCDSMWIEHEPGIGAAADGGMQWRLGVGID